MSTVAAYGSARNVFCVNCFGANLMPTSLLARLADTMVRRRKLVIATWLIALVAAFGASSQLAGDWSADYDTPGSDSKAAAQRLDERFPAQKPESFDVVWTAAD